MTTQSQQLLSLQIQLLALNGLAECVRGGAPACRPIFDGLALALDTNRFDIDTLTSLDCLLADRPAR